jgi:Na+-translocating ferredoxin:NAD+ oxidoreductase RNF subunit RnfB
LSLDDLQLIEEILKLTELKNCSLCGAPDCRTFAEDVIRGNAWLQDCIIIQARHVEHKGF